MNPDLDGDENIEESNEGSTGESGKQNEVKIEPVDCEHHLNRGEDEINNVRKSLQVVLIALLWCAINLHVCNFMCHLLFRIKNQNVDIYLLKT